MTQLAVHPVSAADLVSWLGSNDELALVDAREEVPFSEGHLLRASCIPLSRIELIAPLRIPRRSTTIVLCASTEVNAAAAARLRRLGYTQLFMLEGGFDAWVYADRPAFSGVNVPSKAFGEYVEREFHTPSISASDLKDLLDRSADVAVFDARPFEDYIAETIPTSISAPGAELAFRVPAVVHDSNTLVVVNCAGRTRSILGAQSLIEAGVPQRVVALENGTMGWRLAGFATERGAGRRLPDPDAVHAHDSRAKAERFAARCGVRWADLTLVKDFVRECESRTLYAFDVRSPEESARDPLPGIACAPGGQLVQATDVYMATLRARVLLFDPARTRALMTAAWLRTMGHRCVFVVPEAIHQQAAQILASRSQPACDVEGHGGLLPHDAERYVRENRASILDLSWSKNYRTGHLPGARYASRSRLAAAIAQCQGSDSILLTCEDGRLSALAVDDATKLTALPVRHLSGGVRGWASAGFGVESSAHSWTSEPDDVWLRPFERRERVQEAMSDYLSWEVGLLEAAMRDPSMCFAAPESLRTDNIQETQKCF